MYIHKTMGMDLRKMAFSQVLTQFYFADKIQTRDAIKSGLAFNRLKSLESDAGTAELANWQITPFTTTPFVQRWSEWQEHLFCESAGFYCKNLDTDYEEADDEVHITPTSFNYVFTNSVHLF